MLSVCAVVTSAPNKTRARPPTAHSPATAASCKQLSPTRHLLASCMSNSPPTQPAHTTSTTTTHTTPVAFMLPPPHSRNAQPPHSFQNAQQYPTPHLQRSHFQLQTSHPSFFPIVTRHHTLFIPCTITLFIFHPNALPLPALHHAALMCPLHLRPHSFRRTYMAPNLPPETPQPKQLITAPFVPPSSMHIIMTPTKT